jgi:hypothetical protein
MRGKLLVITAVRSQKESIGVIVPAFQASILFVSRNHALTCVATYFRRFGPGSPAHSIEEQGWQ